MGAHNRDCNSVVLVRPDYTHVIERGPPAIRSVTPPSSSKVLPLSEQEKCPAQTPTKQPKSQSKSFLGDLAGKSKSFLSKLTRISKTLFDELVDNPRLQIY
jgi:hypothetical protein